MKKEKNKENDKQKKGRWGLKMILVIIVIIIGTLLWARFISTSGLKVKEYAITTDNMPNNFDGLKIVHFSDLHYGSTVFISELKDMDLTNMTPFEAMNRLYELQNKVKNRW